MFEKNNTDLFVLFISQMGGARAFHAHVCVCDSVFERRRVSYVFDFPSHIFRRILRASFRLFSGGGGGAYAHDPAAIWALTSHP